MAWLRQLPELESCRWRNIAIALIMPKPASHKVLFVSMSEMACFRHLRGPSENLSYNPSPIQAIYPAIRIVRSGMKTLAFLPVFFCCLLVSDAQQSSVGTTLRGHLEGDSYRNDYFGFTYKLPAGFENAPDQLQRGFIQGLQNSNKGSQLLLMIVHGARAMRIYRHFGKSCSHPKAVYPLNKVLILPGKRGNISAVVPVIHGEGATNEQDYFMANQSTDRRSQIHPASEIHGRRSVFLGGAVEICLRESRSWPIHKTGDSVSPLDGDLHWGR